MPRRRKQTDSNQSILKKRANTGTNGRAKKPRVVNSRTKNQKSKESEKSVEQSEIISDQFEGVDDPSKSQDEVINSELPAANSENMENTLYKSENVAVDNDNRKSSSSVESTDEGEKKVLFEIPKRPRPTHKEYQDKILVKHPWMKKKEIDYLHKILSNSRSELGYKVMKHIINFNVYKNFTDEQKSRLLKLLPRSELVPIASEVGEPIDTPRIERERQAQGMKLYEAGVTETITEIDPTKVVPRFDFWLSDAFKDARWWFQLSIRYGYYTKIGVDTQWDNLEKFKTEIPNYWKNDAFEQDWGIGLWGKMGKKQVAGDSAQISLPDMVKARILRPNDILKYKKQFKGLGVTVNMDLKVTAVNESNGRLQIMLIKSNQSKLIDDVVNPTRLEHDLLDWDGQVPRQSRPNGNAFKNFSIQRSAGYTPSLFEARKEYWAKNS
ncbi:3967_t:CDS:2 [Diversispora eburnea]|uniref:3967_t:CDS:1 n=1 Tax=Diversispora eburnea TaxID=1213867 RepID=A0A9N8VY58_9GLOM|nr:3967_t:CDS:2 [Diversispora eburnea]